MPVGVCLHLHGVQLCRMQRVQTQAKIREVIIDTLCGIDDALALLYLAGRPDVRIAGVSAVYGN